METCFISKLNLSMCLHACRNTKSSIPDCFSLDLLKLSRIKSDSIAGEEGNHTAEENMGKTWLLLCG